MWLLNLEPLSNIYFFVFWGYLSTFNNKSLFKLFGLIPESQSFTLQRLKIKEKMLEAKLYKCSFVALKNERLDLSSTEKVSEVETFFFFNIQLYLKCAEI